ncbi:MAG: DUF2752 domain-containing protein [Cytophagales bacterium]
MFLFKLHRKSEKYGKYFSLLFLITYITVPILLFLLPENHFDHGKSLCMSKLIFNMECYACGITRAIQRWIHFNPEEAMEFNQLSIVVFPLLVYIWAFNFFDEIIYFNQKLRS